MSWTSLYFYPRSPCGERLDNSRSYYHLTKISIHALLAESDFSSPNTSIIILDISIHALLAESDLMWYQCNTVVKISIHALLAESDAVEAIVHICRGISIHALLAESDASRRKTTDMRQRHFYPRSPCGERHRFGRVIDVQFVFLSTLSLRRATLQKSKKDRQSSISIHALLAESDGIHYDNYNLHCVISIHALLAESDVYFCRPGVDSAYFYPRSPCGERRLSYFYIIKVT